MTPPAVRARLAALAAEYALPVDAPSRLASLLELLARDPAAPTTVRRPEDGVDVHVADSLSGLAVPAVRAAARIADLGSGAGLPGLALAIALPGARVDLVESAGRKCEFIARAAEACAATNAAAVHARAEAWPEGLEACDVVTCRALAALPVLVEYGAPLLRVGGTLVAWKGGADAAEVADGRGAAAELGLEAADPLAVRPYPGSTRRHLYVYSKVRATPRGYPRRPGMAAKRPLRARATPPST